MAEFKIKDGVAIIREGTTEIKEYAFYNDKSLKYVVIPKGVSKIGKSAFEGCTSLTTVILPFSVNKIGSDTFKECLNLTAIYVPAKKVNHYKTCLPGKLHYIIKPVNEMQWEEAIRKVLADEGKPMRILEISKKIIKNGYRIEYGNTPDSSVGTYLRDNPNLFKRVGWGVYTLADTSATEDIDCEDIDCEDIDWEDIDWEDIDFGDTEVTPKKTVDSAYKKASDFITSTVPSQDGKELLELIVNFSLAKGVVCFADILDKLEVKFSDEDKKRDQTIDKALLEEKLEELKKHIKEAEYNHQLWNLYGALFNKAERLLADSGDKVVVSDPLFGEFIPGRDGKDKPKVVIYYENIKRFYCEKWEFVAAGVFVHEMFHAWNYFEAEQKPRSVLAIDEPMVEFETLYFLKELETFAPSRSHHLKDVSLEWENRVRNKQISIGDMAAYGFGYYLFKNLSKSDDSIEWIETYSKKSASIKGSNELVKEVENTLIPIYPFKSEAKVMEWFRKIIFDRQTTYVTTGKSAVKAGSHVSLRDLVLACIETIGRKCFDAQELYAFAPIFKVCVPQYQNLESALKQQLDELVNKGRLEALPHSCYSMKLASVEVKPKRPVSTPATTTKSKRAPSIAFTVKFPDDNVEFHEENAVKTYIESLKHIGLIRVQSVGIMKNGYNLVSDVERPPEGGNRWQDYVDSKYIYTKLGNQEKKAYLYQIANELGINIKISDI